MLIDDYLVNFPTKNDVYFSIKEDEQKLMDKRLKEAGTIPQSNMKNAKLLTSRTEAINLMPHDLVVAEIGVAYGDFSEYIIKKMKPRHFFAIDYFNKVNPYISFWGRDDFEKSHLTHEEWYRDRFKNEIDNGKMTVCSGYSWDELSKFEDNYFDYLYLDACHDYASVKKDVEAAYKK